MKTQKLHVVNGGGHLGDIPEPENDHTIDPLKPLGVGQETWDDNPALSDEVFKREYVPDDQVQPMLPTCDNCD